MESPEDLVDKGKDLYEQGKIEEAIGYYDKAICLNSNYFEAWINKAEALAKQGEFDQAVEAYDRALNVKKELKSKEGVVKKIARTESAVTSVKMPEDKNSYLLEKKGDLLRKLGRFGEALECYSSISQLETIGEIIKNIILVIIVGFFLGGLLFTVGGFWIIISIMLFLCAIFYFVVALQWSYVGVRRFLIKMDLRKKVQ